MPFPEYVPDHRVDPDDENSDAIEFTSVEEMSRLYSFQGMRMHTDDTSLSPSPHPNYDDNDPDYLQATESEVVTPNVITEIIQRVTSQMMEYLAPRYEARHLDQLPRIRSIATYWACYLLSGRRGNQPVYEDEYQEGIEALERYREGTLYLDAPSSGPRANVQSYVTDFRSSLQPIRVVSQASNRTVSGQDLLRQYPFFWL